MRSSTDETGGVTGAEAVFIAGGVAGYLTRAAAPMWQRVLLQVRAGG